MRRSYLMLGHGCATVLVLAALTIGVGGGCGSGGSGTDNDAYGEILHGLERAALANQSYGAVNRAQGLKPTLRASIDAFCEVNQEMLENHEAWKSTHARYYIVRIKLRAERELPFVSTGPVGVAVSQYRDLFGLTSFDPGAVRRYSHACYA